jgi:nicotinate-nucleotide pyrophosphorylase (carboxylating)
MTIDLYPMTPTTASLLAAASLDPDAVAAIIRGALAEDLNGDLNGDLDGDVLTGIDVTSTATVPADLMSVATFGARASGVVAGLPVAAAVIEMVCGVGRVGSEHPGFEHLVVDGTSVAAGTTLARVEAPTRTLLTAERTALNLLCHLSGVATLTRRWVDALEGTNARVRDTRKTTPGLRALEKYAVRCGGGVNHRMGLFDMALVKDNHVAAAGGVAAAFDLVRSLAADIAVEIEVDSIDGLREAIAAGADEILIDNFTPAEMREAVAVRDEMNPAVVIEASGGLTLDNAREVGETGVDYIAVGELTHSARVLDIGLDVIG